MSTGVVDQESCQAFWYKNECVFTVPIDVSDNYEGKCKRISEGFLYQEVANSTGRYCLLYELDKTETKDLVLPLIVFIVLCVLILAMCIMNIRERSGIMKMYKSSVHYKELQAQGQNPAKSRRVPQQNFTCGGVTVQFQMSSNLKQGASKEEDKQQVGGSEAHV